MKIETFFVLYLANVFEDCKPKPDFNQPPPLILFIGKVILQKNILPDEIGFLFIHECTYA